MSLVRDASPIRKKVLRVQSRDPLSPDVYVQSLVAPVGASLPFHSPHITTSPRHDGCRNFQLYANCRHDMRISDQRPIRPSPTGASLRPPARPPSSPSASSSSRVGCWQRP
ncbi:hypothetical protein CALCODRAFT_101462 [Calocera cornea HHB12733]|uniref:Uncharacterized protein n=1 Tax=Calocera cornea HHB12733 TaxID=1353952 RepID=A0A165D5U1_9BASI|nr:hypothetical protein CALCODRAFT_101462 [Calocera cornea HHB12733]